MHLVYNLRDQDFESTKSLGILHVSLRVLAGLAELAEVSKIDVLANCSLQPLLPRGEVTDRVCRWHLKESPGPRGWNRFLWDQWSVVRWSNQLAPDWLLLPKGFAPLGRRPRARISAYVHDDIFSHYRARGMNPFPSGQLALFSRSLAHTVRTASVVVTNSMFTAQELRKYGRSGQAPVPIGAPVVPSSSKSTAASDGPILLPTSAWPHKLTPTATAWMGRWQDETRSNQSVVGFGTLPDGFRWPERPHWKHLGRISDTALDEQMDRAAALVYFSEYEGFGLPPVEAAAAGRRVIASDLPPLRETLPASRLFANNSYESFAATLTRALAEPPVAPLKIDSPRDVAAHWIAALASAS